MISFRAALERRRHVLAAVRLADANDAALRPQLDHVPQKVRPMTTAGGEQGRVRQRDWGHGQAGDRKRRLVSRQRERSAL